MGRCCAKPRTIGRWARVDTICFGEPAHSPRAACGWYARAAEAAAWARIRCRRPPCALRQCWSRACVHATPLTGKGTRTPPMRRSAAASALVRPVAKAIPEVGGAGEVPFESSRGYARRDRQSGHRRDTDVDAQGAPETILPRCRLADGRRPRTCRSPWYATSPSRACVLQQSCSARKPPDAPRPA